MLCQGARLPGRRCGRSGGERRSLQSTGWHLHKQRLVRANGLDRNSIAKKKKKRKKPKSVRCSSSRFHPAEQFAGDVRPKWLVSPRSSGTRSAAAAPPGGLFIGRAARVRARARTQSHWLPVRLLRDRVGLSDFMRKSAAVSGSVFS